MRRLSPLVAILIVAAILATFGTLIWHAAREFQANLVKPKEETADLTALVTQVRDLSRLETASMRVVHVGTITQSYRLVPNALAGDVLTFMATGDVIAGVDLSRIQQNDVWREPDGTIALRLPPSQILVSRIDNRESRVLSRSTGVFRRSDINLESRMRQHAEIAIRQEALRKGILTLASQNAETKLAPFLHTLGFQKVRFVRSMGMTPRL
jgi:Protein of unknown function (DUF4230)